MHSNPAYSHVTVVSIGYLISILILTTNGLLLLGLLCDRLSRQSTFGLYVINMCIANFLYGCLTIVQYLPSNVASSMGLNHDTCVYIAATLELLPAVTVLTLLVLLVSELHFLLSGGYEVMKENTRLRCIFGLIGVWFTWILATLVVMPLRMNDSPPPLTSSRAFSGHGVTYFGGSHPGLLRSDVIDDSVRGSHVDASDDRFSDFVGEGVKEIKAARFTGTNVLDGNRELTTNAGNTTLYRTRDTQIQRRSTSGVGTAVTKEIERLDKAKFRSSRSVPRNGDNTPSHRHDVDIEEELLKAFTHGYSPSEDVESSPHSQLRHDVGTRVDDHKHSTKHPEGVRQGSEGEGARHVIADKGFSMAWSAAEASGDVWGEAGGVGLCSSSLLPSHPRKAAVSLVTVFPPTLALFSLSLALLALLFCSQGARHPKHAPKRRRPGSHSVLRWSRLRDDVKREIIVLVVVCIVSVALRMPREVARLVESIASGGEGQWHAMPPYLVLLEMLHSSHAVAQPILWLTLLPAAKLAVRGLCCRGSHASSREQTLRAFPMETSV